ncbi:DUF397 domain-containing protein [Streptomyces sp. NBC_00091]|uniref:DUF397 domain-containing protein n=1 Tax=Streptomyces sp. NBC_00091 TaxID=2975648 RepID=UPI00225C0A35|nr:DUF397 domain-containing protein [Streptomyces sp. NBC_00091]MCX5378708.1 DUF397 domain-containing protein [Streptomyces sp. NBC_00091]
MHPPPEQDGWIKSSHSGADQGNCIEVAVGAGTIRIRDSKVTGGPELAVAPATWDTFLDGITAAG